MKLINRLFLKYRKVPFAIRIFQRLFPYLDIRLIDLDPKDIPKDLDLYQGKAWSSPYLKNLVMAGAGAGKTTLVVSRAKLLCERGVTPSRLLFLTFTNASTEDMTKKLEKVFGKQIEAKVFPKVMTIHKFARECSEKLNYSLKQVYEKKPGSPIFKAYEKALDNRIKKNPLLKDRIYEWIATRVILKRKLNLELVYENPHSGPSIETVSGVMVRSQAEKRIADFLTEQGIQFVYEKPVLFCDWPFRPDFYLPEVGAYLEYLGLWDAPSPSIREDYRKIFEEKMAQFEKHHFEKWAVIDIYPNELDSGTFKDKFTKKYEYLKGLTKRKSYLLRDQIAKDRVEKKFDKEISQVVDFIREVNESIQKNLVDPNEVKKVLPYLFLELLDLSVSLRDEVKSILKKEEKITDLDLFDDLGNRFRRNKDALKLIAGSFDYLFLDEFQDVTPILFYFLEPLMKAKPFFAIGDDRQAIYGFNGGTPYYLRHLPKVVPGTKKTSLLYNYRSNKTIVETSQIFTDPGASKSVSKNDKEAKIYLFLVDDEAGSAKTVLETIYGIVGEKKLMVLYRNNPEVNGVTKPYLGHLRKHDRHYTVHGSKGLEEDAVLVVNIVEGEGLDYTIPARDKDHPILRYIRAQSLQDAVLEEEMRLFYVALSRAREYLFLVTVKGMESSFITTLKQTCKNLEELELHKPGGFRRRDEKKTS